MSVEEFEQNHKARVGVCLMNMTVRSPTPRLERLSFACRSLQDGGKEIHRCKSAKGFGQSSVRSLLIVRPEAPSSVRSLLVAMLGAPSSVLESLQRVDLFILFEVSSKTPVSL